MKFEQIANKLFTNTYFLYAMVFFSMLSILGYLLSNNFDAIMFFVLVGIISINFSRNMAVVLTICLLSTNVLLANKIHEGMKSGGSGKTTDTSATSTTAATEDTTATTTTTTSEEDKKKQMMEKLLKQASEKNTTAQTDVAKTDEPFESMREEGNKKKGANLDYASTIRQAYGDLNNILDPDAIKNLTSETMTLMKEQKKLMDSMSSMQPLMAQAQELVQGFKSGGFANTASSINK